MLLRRLASSALAALIAVPAVMAVTAAPVQAATGPYSGSASSALVHVQAVNAPAINPGLADVRLARSNSEVKSDGLATGGLVPAAANGKRSYARATNLDAPLLAGAVDLNPALSTAQEVAPPSDNNPTTDVLAGPVTVAPVATLTAARAAATARWGTSDTSCIPPGTPISTATSEVLDASLITGQAAIGASLVSVTNAQGGAAFSNTNVGIVDVAGQANKGLRSQSIAQLDGVVLFKGSANEVTINVVAPPTLTSTATGTASTSTITYTAPVLQVIRGGVPVATLDAATPDLDLQIPPGGTPLMVLRLQIGDVVKNITATSVVGSATMLGVTLLDATGTGTLARVEVAPQTASANVPAGGIECGGGGGPNPLENLQVDASTPVVFKDGDFEYAITVPNIGDCTLTNVKIVFTITGPAGTTITSTTPAATNVTGLVATWNDIGPIAPGALKTLKVAVKVPANVAPGVSYRGTAVGTAECNGAPATKTAFSNLPAVGTPSSAACDLSGSSINSSHREVRVGDMFNEYVRVNNQGSGTCNAIKVTLPYPPSTTFVACSDNCTADNAARVVTWTIPSLGSGDSKDLWATFKVNPGATGVLGTTVTVTSGNQTVRDSTSLPRVTALNILNALTQRSRGILPRTGGEDLAGFIGLGLVASFLAMRGLRRRNA